MDVQALSVPAPMASSPPRKKHLPAWLKATTVPILITGGFSFERMSASTNSTWGWVGLVAVFGGGWLWLHYGLPFKVRNHNYRKAIHIGFGVFAVACVFSHSRYYYEKKAAQEYKEYQEKVAAEAERRRKGLIKIELRSYYEEVNELLHVPIPPGAHEAFQEHLANCKKWFFSRAEWIEENMGGAARDKFLDTVGTEIIIPEGVDGQPRILRAILARLKDNLEDMLTEEIWLEP